MQRLLLNVRYSKNRRKHRFNVARIIVLLINHNTVEEKIKIWREKGQHLFFYLNDRVISTRP